MPNPSDESTDDVSRLIGAGLPPGRFVELQPRLQALLTDFAHLAELETAELEPLPVFAVIQPSSDRHE
jgi:hypothetical protein